MRSFTPQTGFPVLSWEYWGPQQKQKNSQKQQFCLSGKNVWSDLKEKWVKCCDPSEIRSSSTDSRTSAPGNKTYEKRNNKVEEVKIWKEKCLNPEVRDQFSLGLFPQREWKCCRRILVNRSLKTGAVEPFKSRLNHVNGSGVRRGGQKTCL